MRVAMLNLKGGVGKTSSCYHLAGSYARQGRRVLLVDADPQASLTQGFFGPAWTQDLPRSASVAALFDPEDSPYAASVVRPTPFPGISILPGSWHLTAYNMLPPAEWADAGSVLRDAVDELTGSWDVVLIDCPPNLHLCSWSAMVAATSVVVPLQPEDFGSQGLVPVRRAIESVVAKANPSLTLAGLLLTMADKRLTVHQTYEEEIRQRYGEQVFAAVVPRAKDAVEAIALRTPLAFYKPKGAIAKAFDAVAAELSERADVARKGVAA